MSDHFGHHFASSNRLLLGFSESKVLAKLVRPSESYDDIRANHSHCLHFKNTNVNRFVLWMAEIPLHPNNYAVYSYFVPKRLLFSIISAFFLLILLRFPSFTPPKKRNIRVFEGNQKTYRLKQTEHTCFIRHMTSTEKK